MQQPPYFTKPYRRIFWKLPAFPVVGPCSACAGLVLPQRLPMPLLSAQVPPKFIAPALPPASGSHRSTSDPLITASLSVLQVTGCPVSERSCFWLPRSCPAASALHGPQLDGNGVPFQFIQQALMVVFMSFPQLYQSRFATGVGEIAANTGRQ